MTPRVTEILDSTDAVWLKVIGSRICNFTLCMKSKFTVMAYFRHSSGEIFLLKNFYWSVAFEKHKTFLSNALNILCFLFNFSFFNFFFIAFFSFSVIHGYASQNLKYDTVELVAFTIWLYIRLAYTIAVNVCIENFI